MRIGVSLLVTALAVAAGPALANNNQVLRGPVPSWVVASELLPVPEGATGLVYVRRQERLVHFDARGLASYFAYRMRILHPNALQLGNLQVAWNPADGAPTVHAIRVHRGDQVIDVLETASFEILRREGQLEAASLDGVLTAVLRIPDLRVGDEVEVALTTREADPTLGGNDAGQIGLSPEPPPGRYRIGLSWEAGHEPRLQMTPDMSAAAVRRSGGITFDFDDPTPVTPPNDAPPRYRWQRMVEYSDYPDWAAISRHFAPLYAAAARLDPESPVKQEARRIAAAHSDPLERARAALRLVQQQVRYVYVGLDGGNYTPATADQTWQRRYGDCKGKTALLLALLGELGIVGEPVLVNNNGGDDGLDERLPNPGMFDHVLVRAHIGGADYWLDGTLPPVAAPSLEPVIGYRWTLPITAQGSSIARRDWTPDETPGELSLYEIDAVPASISPRGSRRR